MLFTCMCSYENKKEDYANCIRYTYITIGTNVHLLKKEEKTNKKHYSQSINIADRGTQNSSLG